MVLTLLSPDRAGLTAMAIAWEKELTKFTAGDLKRALDYVATDKRYTPAEGTLGPEDLDAALRKQLTGVDTSRANGTSIAFLADFQNKSILLLADDTCRPSVRSIRRLLPPSGTRLKVDAVKVAHHGSRHNMSAEFLELVDADHFLFSSDGGGKNHHPTPPVVQAIVTAMNAPTLWFNYRSVESDPWEAKSKSAGAMFKTRYPPPGAAGITLDLCKATRLFHHRVARVWSNCRTNCRGGDFVQLAPAGRRDAHPSITDDEIACSVFVSTKRPRRIWRARFANTSSPTSPSGNIRPLSEGI